MSPQTRRLIEVVGFIMLYPLSAEFIQYIPNPMVPGAIVALNMIVPVLAGYFYGPVTGAVVGGFGTAIAALWRVSMYDGLAIFPHLLMGYAAGWVGNYRKEFLAALTILIGHSLNMLFYLRLALFSIPASEVGTTLLGLAVETMIDMVAIMLLVAVLKRGLYREARQ